jgi:hypothetical protein
MLSQSQACHLGASYFGPYSRSKPEPIHALYVYFVPHSHWTSFRPSTVFSTIVVFNGIYPVNKVASG